MIMFLLTLISWGGALVAAKFLRMTVIRGEASPFVMELPTYLLPTFKGLVIHTYRKNVAIYAESQNDSDDFCHSLGHDEFFRISRF
jgi:Fe2+ transport system protein B